MHEQARGKRIALLGAALQLIIAVVLLITALWTGSPATLCCALLVAGGVLLWLMTAILFYCHQLQQRELAELDDLARQEAAAGTIFEGDHLDAHRQAEARVAFVYRWVTPAFTLLWAALNAAVGFWLLQWVRGNDPALATDAGPALLFVVLVGFVGFLFSAYTLGMSRQQIWRPLRAPSGFMLLGTLATLAVVVSLAAVAWKNSGGVDRVVSFILPLIQWVLAAELLIGFVLSLYRPRMPGGEDWLPYDSRVLAFVANPQRIGRAIADTLNYQFGFEVSRTWFSQLLAKSLAPLLVIGAVAMVLISSIVIVDQGEVAVVTHWGEVDTSAEPLGPGLHMKWPWPIDRARHFDTRVRQLTLGVGGHREHRPDVVQGGTFKGREFALWTEEHGEHAERDFLVAVPRRGHSGDDKADDKTGVAPSAETHVEAAPGDTAAADEGAETVEGKVPAVNVIRLVGAVQYRVVDPYRFGYVYEDPEELLSEIAHRELIGYCSSATLLEAGAEPTDRPEAIMADGREEMVRRLEDRIRQAVTGGQVDLGVEIVAVTFRSVHPATEAAEAFEEVLSARLGQEVQYYRAMSQANQYYVNIADDPAVARKLAAALKQAKALAWLANMERQGADVAAGVARPLDALDKDIQDLDETLRRESILGKLRGGQTTVAVDVRRILLAHREQLERIRDDAQAGRPLDLPAKIVRARQEVESLFERATGEPAKIVDKAWADRWKLELGERGRANAFAAQVAADQAAPDVYRHDLYLDVWDEVLPSAPKYVIGVDPNRIEPRLNLEKGQTFYDQVDFRQATKGDESDE